MPWKMLQVFWFKFAVFIFFILVTNYEITVITGDLRSGGTNANVFIQIYGDTGKTELITLKSRSNNFERGTTEIFKVCVYFACLVNHSSVFYCVSLVEFAAWH